MPGVFISYRRDDTAGYAGRLHGDLVSRFGHDKVFMDINALQPGADYVKSLDEAIASCDVVLALIGPRWVSITDARANRRLDNPGDIVRLEISKALENDDILVVPVLVGDAHMPLDSELPEPLQPLRRRHAFELSNSRWNYDVESLVTRLSQIIPPLSPVSSKPSHLTDDPGLAEFRAWLEPERILSSGPERVELVVENHRTDTTTFVISARRKDAGLDITLPASTLEVEARGKQSISVELTPRSENDPELISPLNEPEVLGFVLNVGPSDAPGVGREVSGVFIKLPAAVNVRLGRREIISTDAEDFDVRVENLDRRAVNVALEAEDHAGQCTFEFDQPRLTIEPRTVAHATLTVTPPEKHAKDARWSFDVRATPIAPPGPPAHAEGVLIYAAPRITVRLVQPELEAVGQARFTVEAENVGATDVSVELSAADPAHACTFAFDRLRAVITPGAVAEFELTVTPPATHPANARWPFAVIALPTGSRFEPARAGGVLVYRPPVVELSVTPAQQSARRAANYEVSVHNPFPVAQSISLTAVDRSQHLSLEWQGRSDNPTIDVTAGETKHIGLRARTVTRHKRKEPLTFSFSITATPVRPPGAPISFQALFVSRPDWRPGRFYAVIGSAIILLGLFSLGAIKWPELLVVFIPIAGGIILRSRRWLLLYPAALMLGLQVNDSQRSRGTDSTVETFEAAAGVPLVDTLRELNKTAPAGIQEIFTNNRQRCELNFPLSACGLTEWTIVALAFLSALVGIVVGRIMTRLLFHG